MERTPGSAIAAPVIETERLRLRAHRSEDLPHCRAMWSDPAVIRFIGGTPANAQRIEARLLAYARHWTVMGFGYWVIEERASAAFAGEIGFASFRREISTTWHTGPELGFALATRFHGRGYATEAVRAVLAWGDVWLPGERCISVVDDENTASRRVLRKAGFDVIERRMLGDRPVAVFSRPLGLPE